MLHHRRRATAGRRAPVPAAAPCLIVLLIALSGMSYGLWRGHWLVVLLQAVTAAIAITGLDLCRRPDRAADHSSATQNRSGPVEAVPLTPRPRGASANSGAPVRAPAAAPISTAVPTPEDLPVVESFLITGSICSTDRGTTTARLSLALPASTEVPASSVVATLLTTGHRILTDHHLAHEDIPEVEVTTVGRSEHPPSSASTTGFTVRITNDLTTHHSSIAVDPNQLPDTQDTTGLIAATLLAGADHLLEHPGRPVRPVRPVRHGRPHTREPQGHRGEPPQIPATL